MAPKHNRQIIQYQSYLLRLWQESPEAEWRILLKEIGGEEQHAFLDTAALMDFLHQQLTIAQRVQHASDV